MSVEQYSGQWTPRIRIGYTNNEVSSYYQQTGVWTRVGDIVQATCYIGVETPGTNDSFLNVTGLPFPITLTGGVDTPVIVFPSDINLSSGYVKGYANPGSTFFFLQNVLNGNPTSNVNLGISNLRSYCYFHAQITYKTDALADPDFVIKGDSMASGDNYFGTNTSAWSNLISTPYVVENDGVSGSLIDYWQQNRDYRAFDKVIMFMGFNNIKDSNQSVSTIISKYQTVFDQLDGNVFCVSVPPLNHTSMNTYFPNDAWIPNSRIQDVNAGILNICGSGKYIDLYSQAVDGNNECQSSYTADGLHPSQTAYDWVIDNIKSKL